MSLPRIESSVTVVTGASSGIGRAAALAFAGAGARVVLASRDETRLRQLEREIVAGSGNALAVPADVTDTSQVEALVRTTLDRFGRIDILVCNAGVGLYSLVKDLPEEALRRVFEVNFFGEEDTRSYLIRMVTDQFTKIINVPNMKDHGAAGVTGCLKNLAYGEFNNVARSHYHAQTETLTFIGTLARVEPLRSRTVLNIMDGLRGVWHAGPFSRDRKYRFYPKQMKFGTDPVAIDRLLIDIIDDKRKKEGVISVWNRDMKYFTTKPEDWERDPNMNRSIREPGHIEYASTLGLGLYDLAKIDHVELTV